MLEDRSYMRQPEFETRQSVTVTLLVLNGLAFLLECLCYGYPPNPHGGDFFALSVDGLRHGYVWQLFSYQLMHGGLVHLLCNCWVIYVFGREVELVLGAKRFAVLYVASGVMGGLLQAFAGLVLGGRFAAPVVGASAGAFGLVAAFATLYPDRQLTLLLFFVLPVTLRARMLLFLSVLLALFGILVPVNNMADAAHLGGIFTGIAFIRLAMDWQGLRWPSWPKFGSVRKRPAERLVKVPSQKSGLWGKSRSAPEDLPAEEFVSKEVDPILDKISAYGIQSLTERERRVLEAARARMGRR